MATYWLTHRLADNPSYSRRYDALIEGISATKTIWWGETSSFLLFDSDESIDGIAAIVREAIDDRVDVVLVGTPYFKDARVLGAVRDDDLFKLMPFTKKA